MKKDKIDIIDDETIEVVIDEKNIDNNVSIDELAYSYRYSGQVDCEYIHLMDNYKLLALLYNIAVGVFPTYKYSTIPYRQYNNKNFRINCLHNIKVDDIYTIKQKLCQR